MEIERSAQAGFSLVELLVAMVILAVGLLGLAELQVTAVKVNSQSETMLAAATIAQGVIEEIVAMDSDDPIFNANIAGATWTSSPVTVVGGGTYAITYDMTTTYQGVTNLCLITVTVESTTDLMHVGGHRKQRAVVATIKLAT